MIRLPFVRGGPCPSASTIKRFNERVGDPRVPRMIQLNSMKRRNECIAIMEIKGRMHLDHKHLTRVKQGFERFTEEKIVYLDAHKKVSID